jgi:hypothetical protein
MDVHSQIIAKRTAADRFRQSAVQMLGDGKIQYLVFAAELEIQAEALEHQHLVLDESVTSSDWSCPSNIESFH